MRKAFEILLDDELGIMLEAYDGIPDALIIHLLADYFTTHEVKLKTAHGSYKTVPAPSHSADPVKRIERAMIVKFDELCVRVQQDPNFGNSTKGKKENFLDGAETMLTEVQYQCKRLLEEQQ